MYGDTVNRLIVDSVSAKEHPLIQEFVNLVDATVGDGVLKFTDIQTPPFAKFITHLAIFRHEKEIDDYRTILFGSHIVSAYGRECTGELMSKMGYDETLHPIQSEFKRTVNDGCRIYTSGELHWLGRDFNRYDLVRIALEHNGRLNETLNFVVFS